MTIKDIIKAETATFTDVSVFGESMVLYPKGDKDNKQDFDGVLDEDSLPGTNEAIGDGRVLNNRTGRRERKSAFIEAPISLLVHIQKQQNPTRPDVILADNRHWSVKRVMGQDVAMFTLLVIEGIGYERRQSRSRTG